MKRCREYILAAANSLDATNSAVRLNIGIKSFESLFREGVVRRMKNRSHKRSRFVAAELDRVLDLLARNVHPASDHDDSTNADFVTLSDACFLYQLSTAQLARLLLAGLLPSSRQAAGIPGFLGVRLNRDEIMMARKVFTEDQIAPRALSQHLGLHFDQLRTLRELHLLPYFPAPPGHGYRSKKSVGKTLLARFLRKYQTVATAARHLDVEENVVISKISDADIMPAKEGNGLPIHYRTDLLD